MSKEAKNQSPKRISAKKRIQNRLAKRERQCHCHRQWDPKRRSVRFSSSNIPNWFCLLGTLYIGQKVRNKMPINPFSTLPLSHDGRFLSDTRFFLWIIHWIGQGRTKFGSWVLDAFKTFELGVRLDTSNYNDMFTFTAIPACLSQITLFMRFIPKKKCTNIGRALIQGETRGFYGKLE